MVALNCVGSMPDLYRVVATPAEARSSTAPDILVSHAVYKLTEDEKTQHREQSEEKGKNMIRPRHKSMFLSGIQSPLGRKNKPSPGDRVADDVTKQISHRPGKWKRQKRRDRVNRSQRNREHSKPDGYKKESSIFGIF